MTTLRSFAMQSLNELFICVVSLSTAMLAEQKFLWQSFMHHTCLSHRSWLNLIRVAIRGIFALACRVMFGM